MAAKSSGKGSYLFFTSIVIGSLCSLGVTAAPKISSAIVSGSGDGQIVSIVGDGFGTRGSAPFPVLFDLGSVAYENGNADERSLKPGEILELVRQPEKSQAEVWEKPATGSDSGPKSALLVGTKKGRDGKAGALYSLRGLNSFLGWPRAYGGSDTPVDNTKLYLAWQIKVKYDPRYYWAFYRKSSSGEFVPGEEVVLSNGGTGQFIGVGTLAIGKGLHHFEFDGVASSSTLKGLQVKGVQSGATAIFPETSTPNTDNFYVSPGSNKYLRVWEDPNGVQGTRISWTQAQIHKDWISAPVTPNEWHLMEFYLDTQKQTVQAWTDRELLGVIDVSNSPAYKGRWSPTVALLGFNGALQEFQMTEIDDIYMDDRFSRIVIGDKPSYKDLDGYELQLPVAWSNQKIDFKLNLGSIPVGEKRFLYVISEDGSVNDIGFPLCEDCKSPPAAVPLSID
ncbi:hypothetical protein [Marinobacter sp. BGYM27]|uniref:hypothetical protein n=1 Tax=Marinobacter sp. BGYM27 TaxID=2975597 RepID=UPI0021A83CCC|nr:hypothetical protein [Marinobacter sp. BGYM27]MDG5499008.1 hypothetical protein [Marinobacter sp. BGYM27]